jgi:hypothetical protein
MTETRSQRPERFGVRHARAPVLWPFGMGIRHESGAGVPQSKTQSRKETVMDLFCHSAQTLYLCGLVAKISPFRRQDESSPVKASQGFLTPGGGALTSEASA